MTSTGAGRVLHTYCAVPANINLHLDQGIDGSDLSTVGVGPVAVVTSELSADRYGPEAWRQHGSDPEWLKPIVAQHHAVLQDAVAQTDVLPLRLPGIYPDLEALRRVLSEQEADLVEALASLRGQFEMGVKVYAGQAPPARDAASSAESGRAYLTRRISEAAELEERKKRQQSAVADAHDLLSQNATSTVVNAPQDAALSGRREPMLLNAAYLISRNAQGGFLASAESLRERLSPIGLLLETTGPWPPYNFTGLSLAKARPE